MNTLPLATAGLPYVSEPSLTTHLMFLAVSFFQSPVVSSNSPGFHSGGTFLAWGVLLRRGEPHHWFQSPGRICEAAGSIANTPSPDGVSGSALAAAPSVVAGSAAGAIGKREMITNARLT